MAEAQSRGSTFVLVHGSWHGSWCWDKVVSLLQARGHNAVVLDLPGRAGDPRPPKELTLADYANKVCQVIRLQPEPVVLVGHSMGGMAVTQAAENCAEGIRAVVYVCAFLLQDGQSLWQAYGPGQNRPTMGHVVVDEEAGVLRFAPDAPLRHLFYHDCSERDFARARAMLVPEPLAPRRFPVRTTAGRFGRIPRFYVETLQDHSVPLAQQREMHTAQPCERVFSLDTGHSPFLAQPGALVEHLLAAAQGG